MVNESFPVQSSHLNGWGGVVAALLTAKQPLQPVHCLIFVHVSKGLPQASSLKNRSSFLAAYSIGACLDSPDLLDGTAAHLQVVVQANMATWSKAELAIAMGTSHDGSRAHELGAHQIWQCDRLRQAQRFLAAKSRNCKDTLCFHDLKGADQILWQ